MVEGRAPRSAEASTLLPRPCNSAHRVYGAVTLFAGHVFFNEVGVLQDGPQVAQVVGGGVGAGRHPLGDGHVQARQLRLLVRIVRQQVHAVHAERRRQLNVGDRAYYDATNNVCTRRQVNASEGNAAWNTNGANGSNDNDEAYTYTETPGIPYMQDTVASHYLPMSDAQYKQALEELSLAHNARLAETRHA